MIKKAGVYKKLFLPNTEIIAVDILKPEPNGSNDSISYAKEVGNYNLNFCEADSTNLQPLFSVKYLIQSFASCVYVRILIQKWW